MTTSQHQHVIMALSSARVSAECSTDYAATATSLSPPAKRCWSAATESAVIFEEITKFAAEELYGYQCSETDVARSRSVGCESVLKDEGHRGPVPAASRCVTANGMKPGTGTLGHSGGMPLNNLTTRDRLVS